jgi:hypothetical protein
LKNIVSKLTIFFYDETVGKGGKHTTKIVVITVLSIALAVVAALFGIWYQYDQSSRRKRRGRFNLPIN